MLTKEEIVMSNNFIIYKAECMINGMVYIGATTSSLDSRKADHLQKAKNEIGHYFHEAISTYGIDAFDWQEVDTARSRDELASKEKEYVIKYNSKEEGYNSDAGGGFKKTVYKYNIENGSLIDSFESLDEAAKTIDSSKQHISRACLSKNKTYGGYYWSYEHKEPFVPSRDKRRKQVIQYTLDGIKIAEFKSVADASKVTGVSKTCISRVCRNEREYTGGHRWSYD